MRFDLLRGQALGASHHNRGFRAHVGSGAGVPMGHHERVLTHSFSVPCEPARAISPA